MRSLSFQEIVEPKNRGTSHTTLNRTTRANSLDFGRHSAVTADEDYLSTLFPQPLIQSVVSRIASDVYDTDWRPHVVRQHAIVTNSSLDYIDYAVPCFDLAKILKRKPADVALELSRMLAGEAASIEYKTEAIGGYVNLQISDTFLAQAMQQAITWLGAPRSLTPRHAKDYFLAVGAIIGQESDFKPADDICRSVDCVYDLLGNDHSMWYLMGDTPTIMGNRLRPALPAHGRAVSRTQQDETLKNMNVDRSQAIFESDLAPMVHDFLNSSVAQDMGLIRDELSQAIYYGKGEMAVALRSAGGTLYPFAYTLYVIESLRSSTGDARRITVFVPSKIGLILKDFLAGRGNELDDLQITCVDPKSLQADVLEIRSAVESLDAHFLKLAQTLQLLSPRPIHAVRNRQAILGVIDMPLALSEMAAKLQLPGIFDAINQSIETEAMLRRLA